MNGIVCDVRLYSMYVQFLRKNNPDNAHNAHRIFIITLLLCNAAMGSFHMEFPGASERLGEYNNTLATVQQNGYNALFRTENHAQPQLLVFDITRSHRTRFDHLYADEHPPHPLSPEQQIPQWCSI